MSESPWLKGLFPIASVFGRVGAVVGQAGDYVAGLIGYDNATSGLASTDVQSAIDTLAAGASVVVPRMRAYTTADTYTWTVPDNMVYAEIVLVGGGQSGTSTAANSGGAGGRAGEVVRARLPGPRASLSPGAAWPTDWPLSGGLELTIVVPAGGAAGGAPGTPNPGLSAYISEAAAGTILCARGGSASAPSGLPADVVMPTYAGALGGAGGASNSAGARGAHSGYGRGGAGGAAGQPGAGGSGFGAGGGGPAGIGASVGGGGGGAGGYGWGLVAGGGGGSGSGGAGARGACFITEWLIP